MDDHFLTLSCARCGAKLDVYDDMERFVCGHCGTEMIVQRRGGTVTLKTVTDAIRRVQVGTDKTAAELALTRLEKELASLKTERLATRGLGNPFKAAADFLKILAGAVVIFLIPCLILTVTAIIGVGSSDAATFTPFALILALVLFALLKRHKRVRGNIDRWEREHTELLAEMDSKIAEVERLIAINRETVKTSSV